MNNINFFERLKSLLLFPSYEWKVISLEKRSLSDDFRQFTFRLIVAGALAQFIGSFIFVRNVLDIDAYRFSFPLVQSFFYIFIQTGLLMICSFFVKKMARKFKSIPDQKAASRLVIYSATPLLMMFVIFNLSQVLFLALLPGFYSLYLFWSGLPILMKTDQSKRISFTFLYFIFMSGLFWSFGKLFGFITGILFPGSSTT